MMLRKPRKMQKHQTDNRGMGNSWLSIIYGRILHKIEIKPFIPHENQLIIGHNSDRLMAQTDQIEFSRKKLLAAADIDIWLSASCIACKSFDRLQIMLMKQLQANAILMKVKISTSSVPISSYCRGEI